MSWWCCRDGGGGGGGGYASPARRRQVRFSQEEWSPEQCRSSCVRSALYAFLLVLLVSGVGLLASGLAVLLDTDRYHMFTGYYHLALATLLITIGAAARLTTVLSCAGTLRDNHCLLATTAILLCVIFMLEVGCGILAYLLRGSIRDNLSAEMWHKLELYSPDLEDAHTRVWDELQRRQQCCGVDYPEDWSSVRAVNPTPPSGYTDPTSWHAATRHANRTVVAKAAGRVYNVPDSCCAHPTPGCGFKFAVHRIPVWQEGCLPRLTSLFIQHCLKAGLIGLASAIAQVFGVICTFCVANNVYKYSKKRSYLLMY